MIEFKPDAQQDTYFLFDNGKSVPDILVEMTQTSGPPFIKNGFSITALTKGAGDKLISLVDHEKGFPEYDRLVVPRGDSDVDIRFRRLISYRTKNTLTFDVLFKVYESEDNEIDFIGFIIGLKRRDFTIKQGDLLGEYFTLTIDCHKGRAAFLLESILECEEKIQKFYLLAVNQYLALDGISAKFAFPVELRASCEQYLLYFAQFLRDLGINASSDLREHAGKVLFSVTPIDDTEALDKIREALAVYLNLPASPIVLDDSFASMRLQQQIENLKHSQKMAARELQLTEKVLVAQSEIIHEKNTIISQKDSTIEQQDKIIEKITSKSIMMDSLKNKEEFEKIFDGLEVGEIPLLKEKLGIKFHPTKSLKSLRGKLTGMDDEIISLNLDKDS
jgi:hypothetical protein